MHSFREPKGVNFSCQKYLRIDDLIAALSKIVLLLRSESSNVELHRYDDWWEHDGLHFHKGKTDFEIILKMLRSPKELYGAMPEGFAVRIGIAPDNMNWYLRLFVDWDDDDADLEGNFDITLPGDLAEKFRKEIMESVTCGMNEEPSEAYFAKIKT